MDYFSYNEVLYYLEVFFKKEIKDPASLKKMLLMLQLCREHKTVTIRAIDRFFMNYRKKFEDYTVPTTEEEEVWKSLLNAWQ